MDIGRQLSRSHDISTKVSIVLQKRVKTAQEKYTAALQHAFEENVQPLLQDRSGTTNVWTDVYEYAVDTAQRSILFWDTLRQRGNNFIEHTRQGFPPMLHFKYEVVVDGRKLPKPVNYALVRILPPQGVSIDPKRRPYMIIDPRAGHGPGIGGM